MKKCYILCRSVTYASKGAKLLRKDGINAAVERPPKQLFQQPCGYCIVINDEYTERALHILRQSDIEVKAVAKQ